CFYLFCLRAENRSHNNTQLITQSLVGIGVLPDDRLNAAVGGTMIFTTTMSPTEKPFSSVNWSFNVSTPIIVFVINAENIIGPEYEGRITFFPSTASLELRSLTLDDTGEYTVNAVHDGTILNGRTTLVIHEKVSSVLVTSSSTDLVEFSGSVSLSCSASGPSLSFLWLNGSSEVTASDRVQLTDGDSSLTIITVTRFDQGPFRCRVSNPVSTVISDPVNLSITSGCLDIILDFRTLDMSDKLNKRWMRSFFCELETECNILLHFSSTQRNFSIFPLHLDGPENMDLISSPPQGYFAVGSDISLTCSVGSRPPAHFKWFLNGDQLPDTGSELRLMDVQMSQSGNYICQAFNSRTLRYETSPPSAITVLGEPNLLLKNVRFMHSLLSGFSATC
uniref:Ig-like domain-containing protein n=1 Tax=Maylandia zebra TaxID=106582 RepID=A0A3P9AXP2_9CICH